MDTDLAVEWAKTVCIPFLEQKHPPDRQVLLLQDSLKAQRTGEYIRTLQESGIESAFGPKNQTEYWQPIDAGHIGAVLKQLARTEFEKWMESVSNPDAPRESQKYNWQIWEGNRMKMYEKRILMTWVFGRAWEQLLSSRYRRFRQNAFANCGALLSRTGINDGTVIIEGAPLFSPPCVGTVLYDQAYENQAWTAAPEFIFSNELPGGNDQLGPDSSSEDSSEPTSDSESSSGTPVAAGVDRVVWECRSTGNNIFGCSLHTARRAGM